jgi:hypothetical protein
MCPVEASVVQVGNEHHSYYRTDYTTRLVPASNRPEGDRMAREQNPSPQRSKKQEQQQPAPSIPVAEERATFYSFDDSVKYLVHFHVITLELEQ